MDNFTGSVNSSVGARSEVAGRNANFKSGFRNQVVPGAALLAVTVGVGWLLFSGPSDREVIDDRLDDVGVTATYVGEAPDGGYLFTVNRACGDEITVSITVGESQLDKPRPIVVDEPGGSAYQLTDGSMPRLLNC